MTTTTPIDAEVLGTFPNAVDNSMRKTLVRCQKMAYWKYERGLTPIGETRVHLEAGRAFAAGLCAARRAFYERGISDPTEQLKEALPACRAAYNFTGEMPKYCYKSLDRVEGALAFYLFEKWPLEHETLVPMRLNDGSLAIELAVSYEIPVKHPTTGVNLIHVANFDLLAVDPMGRYWIIDEKTTGKMGDSWALQWTLDSQLTGYCKAACILLQRNGIANPDIAGAIIRGIAFQKDGYVGMECLEPRQPWEIERWYHQMILDMAGWSYASEHGLHNMVMDHACALYNSPCEYARLCKALEPEKLISPETFHVKHYDPLNRD